MKAWAISLALGAAATAFPSAASAQAGVTVDMADAVAPNRYVWSDTASVQPVSIVVSTADQRAYVYRGQVLISVSSVSTGKDGKATPAGTYPILQKKAAHRSNLYDASMPYMQRLTWDGIALHAGPNPGFPASHGCIRLPTAFARRLFAITAVGSTVTVMDEAFIPGDDWTAAPDPNAEAARANTLQIAALERR